MKMKIGKFIIFLELYSLYYSFLYSTTIFVFLYFYYLIFSPQFISKRALNAFNYAATDMEVIHHSLECFLYKSYHIHRQKKRKRKKKKKKTTKRCQARLIARLFKKQSKITTKIRSVCYFNRMMRRSCC